MHLITPKNHIPLMKNRKAYIDAIYDIGPIQANLFEYFSKGGELPMVKSISFNHEVLDEEKSVLKALCAFEGWELDMLKEKTEERQHYYSVTLK